MKAQRAPPPTPRCFTWVAPRRSYLVLADDGQGGWFRGHQGNGFTGATDVQFNGVPAPFAIDSDTQISARSRTARLWGRSPSSRRVAGLSVATFKVQPNITGFSPASGPSVRRSSITGTAFTGATVVWFNAIPATFTVDSTPDYRNGALLRMRAARIEVTTPGGNGSSSTNFKVPASISSFTPGSGPVGTTVVITGVAFTGTTVVAFNGIVATTFNVDSDTQITVVVPAGATTGKIKVTTVAARCRAPDLHGDALTGAVGP